MKSVTKIKENCKTEK